MVQFDFTLGDESGTCESNIGMAGGTQTIGGSELCAVTTILHEMGHAIGLFHEQSRADRNSYVNYLESNVDKPQGPNFDIYSSGADSGLFNYASIMEYGAFSFSRDGLSPTLESIPAGIPLSSDASQYTTGDLDGIMRLYGHPPSAVTIDSNPTGLQLLVDSVPCTAPCVFTNWTLGSQHTLDSQTVQTLSGQSYLFGRWNTLAGTQTPITVTNSAGTGTLLSPTTSPAITTYLASFIPIHPYSPIVTPANSGTITSSPPPSTMLINGVSTNYYLDRQQVTITVHPNPGYNFLQWYNLSGFNLYSNPYSFYVISNLDYYNFDHNYPVQAALTTNPVLTIASASPDIGPGGSFGGLAVGIVDVDNNNATTTAYTPQNLTFPAGEHLTLCASSLNGTSCPGTAVAQSPVTTNINYLFSNWTGSAAANTDALAITMPSSGQATYTAHYTPSFRTIVMPSLYCNGDTSVTSSPTGVNSIGSDGNLDAFLNSGTVDFTANAGSTALNFVGWSQDLSGSANPLAFNLTNQVLATANFNVPNTSAPLSISGVSPGANTLTVTGTGFTTNPAVTVAYFGPTGTGIPYRSATLTSSTQLTVQLNTGDLATPGYYQVAVYNMNSGCSPSVFYNFSFPVTDSAGPPAWTVAKLHVGDFGQGQNGAQYTVLVTNSGTGPSVGPVAVTEAVPSGETLVSMSGTGWDCSVSPTCVRSDALAAGRSYPAITVTVNVSPSAVSPQVNSVTVGGGAAASATAMDSTTVHPDAVPNVVGLTQSAATMSIQNQGLVLGTVVIQSSNTVASGNVISESPSAGTVVDYGSAVSLVVSTGTATLQSIAVTPANPSIAKGLTQQFTATGTYSDNSTQNLTNSVTWTNAAASGLATGSTIGTNTITATSGAIHGSTTLTVTAATLLSIAVTPANPSIAKGLTQQFTATGTYSDNSTQNLTNSVTWTNAAAGGLATGSTIGTSTITATSGAIHGSTTLTVTAATLQSIAVTPANPSIAKGLTQQFTATGTYSDNSTQNLTNSVTWTNAAAGGLATGSTVGTSTITATSGAIHGSTTLTVTAATLQSITVTPVNPSIAKGLTQQFTATGTYSDNSTQDLTNSVTWTNAAASGLATGSTVGTSTITATSGAIHGSTTLTVTAATLQSITVTPANPSIAKGLTQQFTATGTYSDNSTQNLTNSVTWTNAAAGGLATGSTVGTSTITATSGAIHGSTTLTVLPPPCDLNQTSAPTVTDIQSLVNQALGVSRALNDLNGGGVNVTDVQIILNAATGLGCTTQ